MSGTRGLTRIRTGTAPDTASMPLRSGLGFIILATAICFLVSLSQTLSIPIMLTLTNPSELRDATGAAWATYAPLILAAGATPIVSRLSDLHGRRAMMAVCLAIALVGSLIGPLGTSPDAATATAVIGRALHGIGYAIVPVVLAAARDVLHPDRMLAGMSAFGAGLGMGGIVGAPLGGILFELVGWRPVFWGYAVCCALALYFVYAVTPVSAQRLNARFDWRGAVLLPLGVMTLLTVALQAPSWGYQAPLTLSLTALGTIALALWVITALRTRSPVFNLRAFRHRSVRLAHFASAGIGWIIITNTLLVALQLHAERRSGGLMWTLLPPLMILLPTLAALVCAGPCSALIVQRWGPRVLLLTGALTAFVGFVLRLYAAQTSVLAVIWATVIATGATLAATALPMLLNLFSSAQRIGALNGMNWLMRIIGTSLGGAVVVQIATTFAVTSTESSSENWRTMWVVLLVSALVSAIVVALAVVMPMPTRRRPTD